MHGICGSYLKEKDKIFLLDGSILPSFLPHSGAEKPAAFTSHSRPGPGSGSEEHKASVAAHAIPRRERRAGAQTQTHLFRGRFELRTV